MRFSNFFALLMFCNEVGLRFMATQLWHLGVHEISDIQHIYVTDIGKFNQVTLVGDIRILRTAAGFDPDAVHKGKAANKAANKGKGKGKGKAGKVKGKDKPGKVTYSHQLQLALCNTAVR